MAGRSPARRSRSLVEENSVLAEIGRIVSVSLDFADVYEPFAAALARLVPFDRLNIVTIDHEAGTITNAFVTGAVTVPGLEVGDSSKIIDSSSVRALVEKGEGILMSSAEQDEVLARSGVERANRAAGLLSKISAPFLLGDEIVGLMNIRSRLPSAYDREHLRLAQLVASQIAGFFSNSQAYRRRVEAEEALRESERRFREMFDEAPVGYYETDRESRITAANRTLQEMLDYSSVDLVGRHSWDFMRESAAAQQMFNKWLTSPGKVFAGIERTFLRRDGQPLYAIAEARQIRTADGGVQGLRITVQDITELKRIEAGMRETSHLASIGELAAGVAHELNNPLTSVAGFSELLLDERDPQRVQNYVQRINIEAQRAARIVQGLLSFARPRELEMKMVDLRTIVGRVVDLKTYDLRTANVTLDIDLPEEPASTRADEHLLTQVLLNVVTNAEQVLNELRDGRSIRISLRPMPDFFRITVSDNGRGIAPDVINRVFEPFFTTKDVGEGTGLGLSMAYGIVRQHDGEISVESPPSGGVNFHIDIPVRLEEDSAPGDGPRRASPDPANTGANRVLAIDDEPHTRELVRAALSRLGFQVDVARNSHEALILMEDSPYQCLILDLKMPGMSGEDLFGIISRNRPDLAERVLFVTGDTVSPRTRDFLASTGRPWRNEPVHLQELAGEVVMVCEAASALEQSRPQGEGR